MLGSAEGAYWSDYSEARTDLTNYMYMYTWSPSNTPKSRIDEPRVVVDLD